MFSGRRPLEQRVEAGRLDEPRPALRPAVADPVRRDQLRGRALVARGELVLRPAVQPVVERLRRRQRVVEQLHHLVDGHAVVGDLEREVRVVAHLARHLVAQLDQLDQARLQRPADLLRHRPDALALVEIARLLQDVVDVVGGDRLGAAGALGLQAEGVAVEDRRLLGSRARRASRRPPGSSPGSRRRSSSSLRSWRTVRSSSCFSFLSSAFVLSMTVVEPLSAASALSAPVRWATCSGVTSVAAAQSASAGAGRHRRQRGPSPSPGTRRPPSGRGRAWRLAGLPGLPALPALGAPPAPRPRRRAADRQATRTPMCRIEGRMSRTYLNQERRRVPPFSGLALWTDEARGNRTSSHESRPRARLRRRPGAPADLRASPASRARESAASRTATARTACICIDGKSWIDAGGPLREPSTTPVTRHRRDDGGGGRRSGRRRRQRRHRRRSRRHGRWQAARRRRRRGGGRRRRRHRRRGGGGAGGAAGGTAAAPAGGLAAAAAARRWRRRRGGGAASAARPTRRPTERSLRSAAFSPALRSGRRRSRTRACPCRSSA